VDIAGAFFSLRGDAARPHCPGHGPPGTIHTEKH
jgi:hypothetical protein